ncbi:DMT family transporter [Paraburkholderia sp.]|uniref:DMT family transporter n=1 Tax=Paraburkholderia sp. TaxID=1926495 RepID=UPI003D6FFCAE
MTHRSLHAWPVLAIMLGASVWGTIWYPLRMLAALGVSGTEASALTSTAAFLCVLIARRRALATFRWHWLVPALGFTSGITNLGFVWGTIHGEVMRVLLLFYLTPAWTALFAHFVLRERLTWTAVGLAALSLAGAMLMLWSPRLGMPMPGSPAEWAGLAAGMGFALSNVLIVKTSRVLPDTKAEVRTATIFGGAAIFSSCAALLETVFAPAAGLPLAHVAQPGVAVLLVAALGFVLASNNVLVQYGLARVAANRASVVMLFEIVVTALSAWFFAGETPGPREWAGGACIVLASALASWAHRRAPPAKDDAQGNTADDPAPDASPRDRARAMV